MANATVLFIGTGTPSFTAGGGRDLAATQAPAPAATADSGGGGGGGLDTGYIIGISAGVAGVLAVGGGLGVMLHKTSKRRI